MDVIGELIKSLKTGFVDKNHALLRKDFLPELIVNDSINGKRVLTTIEKELRNCEEFWFSVAFVTKSGVATLINLLEELETNKIKGKILVSQYQNFTQPEALKSLLRFKNIELKIVVDGAFHAKGYLFKKQNLYNLIIGSSNLTASALLSNKEWNLKISATDNSNLINVAVNEFQTEFDNAISVSKGFIEAYEKIYQAQVKFYVDNELSIEAFENKAPEPNGMQKEALLNLKEFRKSNKNKALIISATGTGKTYLSAFDVKVFNPKKFLFIVHRSNIAQAALRTFKRVFGKDKTMGFYSSKSPDRNSDFLFTTIQTISADDHLLKFSKTHFDYIVIDETHRAKAKTYQKILQHFHPKFLLGMTATPERTGGTNIFKEFDYNFACEIRLQRALKEDMLCPFHYYGVTDVSVGTKTIDEDAAFNLLTSKERVDRIIDKANFYGCDNGTVRGLIFCRSKSEMHELSKSFNKRGLRTVALDSDSSPEERETAINRLESENEVEQLDYIFSVDIFSEGIDIPKVNQIIMLRPTQSAIIFVQQLGRGLRKVKNKEYLTVIDFIGNYTNNYLVPIALYGNDSYNKDTLRKLMVSGSNLIPGCSTVNFDKISKDRIFESIDNANMTQRRDLSADYQLLKFKIGRRPMMMDFVHHGSRDPYLFIINAKSYFNFAAFQEESLRKTLSIDGIKTLELFSSNVGNAKRIEDVIILTELLKNGSVSAKQIKNIVFTNYAYHPSKSTIESCINNINFEFIGKFQRNLLFEDGKIKLSPRLSKLLSNSIFRDFVEDLLTYAHTTFDRIFDESQGRFFDGFILYNKYSRKDVLRILNWKKNPPGLNVGGYVFNSEKTACPIFVNYKKEEGISSTINYKDHFISNYEFEWFTKSNRTLKSPEVIAIENHNGKLKLPLFIKKSNGEADDFYFMGELTPITIEQTTMSEGNSKEVPVVKINFSMNHPVEDSLYQYLIS